MNILINRCNHGKHFHCDLIFLHIKFLHKWHDMIWFRLKTEIQDRDAWFMIFGNVWEDRISCCSSRQYWLSNYSSADVVISEKVLSVAALCQHYTSVNSVGLFKCLFTTNAEKKHLYRECGIIFVPVPACSRLKRMDFDCLSDRKWQDSCRQTASGHLWDRWLPPPTLPHL